jgi:hypothetical protein
MAFSGGLAGFFLTGHAFGNGVGFDFGFSLVCDGVLDEDGTPSYVDNEPKHMARDRGT